MTLARQKTKPGLTSGKAFMWALARGIALLLLFNYQSWASVICHCADESVSHQACCPAGSHSSCDAETPEMNSRPQGAAMCCHPAPQAPEQTFSITTPIFTPAEDHIHGSGSLMDAVFTPEYPGVLLPPLSRPLYLTHSSLLI
jgi:hypothetical protein